MKLLNIKYMVIRVISYTCAAIFGGNWTNSTNCSSRSSNWNNSPLDLNENYSGRSTTDTRGLTFISTLQSICGWLKWANTFNLKQQLNISNLLQEAENAKLSQAH